MQTATAIICGPIIAQAVFCRTLFRNGEGDNNLDESQRVTLRQALQSSGNELRIANEPHCTLVATHARLRERFLG